MRPPERLHYFPVDQSKSLRSATLYHYHKNSIMKGVRTQLSAEDVVMIKSHLEWDDKDLCLRWRVSVGKKIKSGQVAGSMSHDGYLRVGLRKRTFQQHIVVWVLTRGSAPTSEIDHINGVKDDNRPENLRLVSHAENCRNRRVGVANKTGFLGVLKPVGHNERAYQSTIINPASNRKVVIGSFRTFKVAVLARKFMQAELGYHRLHGDKPITGLSAC